MDDDGPPHRDRETLRRLYYEEGLTQGQIADALGCSSRTIVHWMDRYGLGPGSDCPKHPLPRVLDRMDADDVGEPRSEGSDGWKLEARRDESR